MPSKPKNSDDLVLIAKNGEPRLNPVVIEALNSYADQMFSDYYDYYKTTSSYADDLAELGLASDEDAIGAINAMEELEDMINDVILYSIFKPPANMPSKMLKLANILHNKYELPRKKLR